MVGHLRHGQQRFADRTANAAAEGAVVWVPGTTSCSWFHGYYAASDPT